MLPQTTYHMRAHVDGAGGSWVDQDQAFTTGTLPTTQGPTGSPIRFPGVSVTLPTPGLTPSPGVELLSLTAVGVQSVAVDLQGNVIWYCPGNAEPVKPMQNGHFIIVRPMDIQEVDLACNVVRDVSRAQVNNSLQANGYDFTLP